MAKQKENEDLTQRFRKQFSTPEKSEETGEATDRSSPIALDQPYQIRFERPDIKEMEFALSTVLHREIGYTDFITPGIFGSLTATEIFIWRGLREENKEGQLVHVFSPNTAGFDQAGELLWSFMQDGGDMRLLNQQIAQGFVVAGIARRVKKGSGQPGKKSGPKNSRT